MPSIKSGFLPPQTLSALKGNKDAVKAIKQAATQEGSEIVFKDKNDKIQTVKLDQYLNNPELNQFKGAKSATLTLDVGNGTTVLLDVQELSKENLLKAVSGALTQLQNKGAISKEARFKQSAAPIFNSMKPTQEKPVPQGIDKSTQISLRKEPVPKTIGAETTNFLDILNPLDSPGDSIDIKLEASASAKIWGPLGIEATGNAGLNISVDDDGLFYVKFAANADVGVTVEGGVKGVKVKGKAAAGAGVGVVYRFKNATEANQFLLQKFNDALPDSVRKQFLPGLEKNSQSVNVKPTRIDSLYVKVEGEVEIGKIKVAASFEHRKIDRTFFTPSGSKVLSNDFNQTTSLSVSLGSGVELSGSYSEFRVEKDNIPENTGTYKAIDGSLTFTLPKGKGADHLRAHIEKAATNLGFSGDVKAKFIEGVLARADSKIKSLDGQRDNKPSIKIGVAIQAQWEDKADGGSGELQYFRVGATASVEVERKFNVGVVKASVKGSASATDLTDIIIGKKDETYLAGLYFNNPKQYEIAKGKVGGGDTLVGPEGNQKTLNQWEQEWKVESKTRVNGAQVDISLNELGEAERAYAFLKENFDSLDTNSDGYIYTDEIENALSLQAFGSEDQKAALQYLLDNIATLEEFNDDEYGDENDGITLKDLEIFIQSARK